MEKVFRLFKVSRTSFYKTIRRCLNTDFGNPYMVIENRDREVGNIFISDFPSPTPFSDLCVIRATTFSRPIFLKGFLGIPKVFYISESSCRADLCRDSWTIQLNGMYNGGMLFELFNDTRRILFTNEKELTRWIKE